MSTIAARVGGSKGTLYNYFSSKEELFEAVVVDACTENAEAMFGVLEEGQPVGTVLRRVGRAFLTRVLAERAVSLHRMVIAETHRFPELGQIFYDSGPRVSQARLASFLHDRMHRGELREVDPLLVAKQFFALCKGGLHMLRLCNLLSEPSADDIGRDVDATVDMVMAAYGVPHAEARQG